MEDEEGDKQIERALAFLDTMSIINEDGSIKTRVYITKADAKNEGLILHVL